MVDDPVVFDRAPFLHAEGLRDSQMIQLYADVTGALPGSLSLRAVWSRDFSFLLAVEEEHFWPKYRRDGRSRRQKYMAALVRRLAKTQCNRPVPAQWDSDTWAYRTAGDWCYVSNLKRGLV